MSISPPILERDDRNNILLLWCLCESQVTMLHRLAVLVVRMFIVEETGKQHFAVVKPNFAWKDMRQLELFTEKRIAEAFERLESSEVELLVINRFRLYDRRDLRPREKISRSDTSTSSEHIEPSSESSDSIPSPRLSTQDRIAERFLHHLEVGNWSRRTLETIELEKIQQELKRQEQTGSVQCRIEAMQIINQRFQNLTELLDVAIDGQTCLTQLKRLLWAQSDSIPELWSDSDDAEEGKAVFRRIINRQMALRRAVELLEELSKRLLHEGLPAVFSLITHDGDDDQDSRAEAPLPVASSKEQWQLFHL